MASNPQVHGMPKEMLEFGKTPEEVCRDCPERLTEVRQRWQDFQLIDVQEAGPRWSPRPPILRPAERGGHPARKS
jgi:hypothetical protein